MSHEGDPFRRGYVVTSMNGTTGYQYHEVNWQEAANSPTKRVGELDFAKDSWYFAKNELEVGEDPMACTSRGWPSMLFEVSIPEGAETVIQSPKRVCSNVVDIIAEVDPLLQLGPQRDELVAMAGKLHNIRDDQQQAIRDSALSTSATNAARRVVVDIAAAAGRQNRSTVYQFMWHRPESVPVRSIWARDPIGNAAVALAYRDLLQEKPILGSQTAWDLYGEVLYRPWREVME